MNLSPDQLTWLSANKDGYELILMHAILHDQLRRAAMINLPLTARDFSSGSLAAIWQGVVMADGIMRRINFEMPTPPGLDCLRPYMVAATKDKTSIVAEDELPAAYDLLEELQSPHRKEQWYFLDTYFSAWLTSSRAKIYARRAQMNAIANADEMVSLLSKDIQKANAATFSTESDDMYKAIYGTDEERKTRIATGFSALDQATGGGFGEAECFGLFSGTKGGKSVCAAQVGYYIASTGGDTLIISTEMPVMAYINRMISNACSIKISLIKDCLNVGQIRQVVTADNPSALDRVDVAVKSIVDRVRIVKVHPDQGLGARALMEQQVQVYIQQKGRRPSIVIFDWLGRIADSGNAAGSSSDRILAWERAADSCVQFSEVSGIPALILFQAVNNAQTKSILTLDDIGISKGVFKQMTMGFGITNTIDKAAIKQALMTGALQDTMYTTLEDQLFCIVASRQGEATYIPVKRQFLYQRFVEGKRGR